MNKKHLQFWGVAYVLAILWIGSSVGQLIAMQDKIHQEGYDEFWATTFENWQSEFMQLFVQAVLLLALKHFWFKADAQDMEQVHNDLAQIKEHLEIR